MDRKLRPIYEAIDARNYKQSLKLCNNFLKKKEDSQHAKVLKALTLQRLGKSDEAESLCQ
jgi:N-terminal acetyltransferase B complex non-catalytic subunit